MKTSFFLENTMILGGKLRNLTLISSEEFFGEYYAFGTKSQQSESDYN